LKIENRAPDTDLKAAFPVVFGSTPGAPGVILPDMRATSRKATVTLAFPGLEGRAINTPSWGGNRGSRLIAIAPVVELASTLGHVADRADGAPMSDWRPPTERELAADLAGAAN